MHHMGKRIRGQNNHGIISMYVGGPTESASSLLCIEGMVLLLVSS